MTKESVKRESRYCEYCDKLIYGNSHAFKSHLFQHNAVKPRYMCDVCSKPYFRKDTYARHMNNHLQWGETNSVQFKYNMKVYICDYCERCFRDKRNLINHLKVHDDGFYYISKLYKCRACHISYCEERLLKNHIRKEHFNLQRKENIYELKKLNESWLEPIRNSKACVRMTKVKPNVISIQRSNVKLENTENDNKLQSEVNFKDILHYSKVTCDYCKKDMLKKSLLTHIKERHLKIRKFSCTKCKRTFNRRYQMVDHDCGKVRVRKTFSLSHKN
ncbi:zinc finger protein 809-like [Plodia interpunctella]|uniref:zinc finger protein 809-like n=1 Tax=Plodia interpunctella TaxID=58824 RepID=UPI002367D175|nr:zinc finger protein 809-like [Plodia interpunctella]